MSSVVRPYHFVRKSVKVACWLFLVILAFFSLLLLVVSQYSSVVEPSLKYIQPEIKQLDYQPLSFSKSSSSWLVSTPSLSVVTSLHTVQARSVFVHFNPWQFWPRAVEIASLELYSKTNDTAPQHKNDKPLNFQPYLSKLREMEPIDLTIEKLYVHNGQNNLQSNLIWRHGKNESLTMGGQAFVPDFSSEKLEFSTELELKWVADEAIFTATLDLADSVSARVWGGIAKFPPGNMSAEEKSKVTNDQRPVTDREKPTGWDFSWQLSWSNQALWSIFQKDLNTGVNAEFAGNKLAAEGALSISRDFRPQSIQVKLLPFERQFVELLVGGEKFTAKFHMPELAQLNWSVGDGYLDFQEIQMAVEKSSLGEHALKIQGTELCRISLCQFSIEGQSHHLVFSELDNFLGSQTELDGELKVSDWAGQVSIKELQHVVVSFEHFKSNIDGFAYSNARLGTVEVSLDDAQLDADWTSAVPRLKLSAPLVNITGRDAQFSPIMKVKSIDFGLENLSAKYAVDLSVDLSWKLLLNEIKTEVVGRAGAEFVGQLKFSENKADFSGQLLTDLSEPILGFEGWHVLAGAGNSISQGDLRWRWQLASFSKEHRLASRFGHWPLAGDLLAGNINGGGDIAWKLGTKASPELSWQGNGELELEGVSGVFADIGFVGLNFEQTWALGSAKPLFSQGPLTIDSLDVGLPVSDIGLDLQLSDFSSLTIKGFNSRLLGGRVMSPKFQLAYTDTGLQSIGANVVEVSQLKLESLLKAADYAGLDATANISGKLPIDIRSGQLHIENGTLAAIEPGYIRYAGLADSGNPLMEVVSQALDNYHYDELSADVKYDDKGYLELAVALQGQNPDFQNGRQVNLNLNISDNIPNLMKSLQAGRLITDVISDKLEQ